MSQRLVTALLLSSVLAGCGGSPWIPAGGGGGGGSTDQPDELPGTPAPTKNSAISRYEDVNDANGNGYAQSVTYDAVADTFTVDNLGFDGANEYKHSPTEPANYPFRVYEAQAVVTDPKSGKPIPQFVHRLVAGTSTSGQTGFAIVRTGAYVGYGFGGFLLYRKNGTDLPKSGQAVFNGDYGGLRDFNGRSGLQVTAGSARVAIDFEDFNSGSAVQGTIYDRHIYDLNGGDITASVIGEINAHYNPDGTGVDISELPTINFRVGPGVIDANGEIRGFLDSFVVDYRSSTPSVITFETGSYYAILSGDDPNEVVGVIVVEADDPGNDGGQVRETGGFIAYR